MIQKLSTTLSPTKMLSWRTTRETYLLHDLCCPFLSKESAVDFLLTCSWSYAFVIYRCYRWWITTCCSVAAWPTEKNLLSIMYSSSFFDDVLFFLSIGGKIQCQVDPPSILGSGSESVHTEQEPSWTYPYCCFERSFRNQYVKSKEGSRNSQYPAALWRLYSYEGWPGTKSVALCRSSWYCCLPMKSDA